MTPKKVKKTVPIKTQTKIAPRGKNVIAKMKKTVTIPVTSRQNKAAGSVKRATGTGEKNSRMNAKKTRSLVVAVGGGCFWMNGGTVLRDLVELKNALLAMSKEQYDFHANKERNDFAAWVEGVLQDEICARGLRNSMTAQAASKVIEKALQNYHL